jgi:hypothetical protein
MDAVVFGSRSGLRLELVPAAYPWGGDRGELPTWQARLTGAGLAVAVVCPEASWEQQSLADYLAGLDRDWRGWDGERVWQSEEVELRLTARHDKTNTVLVGVELVQSGSWRVETELELDPGVFRQLAADARALGPASLAQTSTR